MKLFFLYIKHFTDDADNHLKYKSGIVYDSYYNKRRFLSRPENRPFWKSKLVEFSTFDKLTYDPITNASISEFAGRIYHYNIEFDSTKLQRMSDADNEYLSYILAQYMQDQLVNNDYSLHHSMLKSHIDRYSQRGIWKILPWYIHKFHLKDSVYFDLKKKLFVPRPAVIKGKYSGGVIQSNNPIKIIHQLASHKSCLVIMPSNMSRMWIDYYQSRGTEYTYLNNDSWYEKSGLQFIGIQSHTIITYDFLLNSKNVDCLLQYAWDRVIIHESHAEWYDLFVQLVAHLNVVSIWMVNQFPLKYYFKTDSTLKVHELYSLWNIWLQIDPNTRVNKKNSIMKYILRNNNALYKVVNYAVTTPLIGMIEYKYNSFERALWDQFEIYLNAWLQKLSKPIKAHKYNLIRTRFINNLLELSNSSCFRQDIAAKMDCMIKLISSEIKEKKSLFDRTVSMLSDPRNICYPVGCKDVDCKQCTSPTGALIIKQIIASYSKAVVHMDDNSKKLEQISNHIRHRNDENECQICYTDVREESEFLVTYCGHTYCIACMIQSIALKTECPICRNHLILSKCNIVRNTQMNTLKMTLDTLTMATPKSIIITDYTNIRSIIDSNIPVLTRESIYLLTHISAPEQVIFITTSDYSDVQNYFGTLNRIPRMINILIK
jgi:hypothetical protein